METDLTHRFDLALPFDEFRVWSQRIRPLLVEGGVQRDCLDVLEHVCTEMLNNALDHSEAKSVAVAFDWSPASVAGTRLRFRVSRRSPPSLRQIFDRYCPQPELQFSRTEVSVALMQQTDGALVSRSQGKRLVMGLDKFASVSFDFSGIESVNQGFADEVFRVRAHAHPEIEIRVTGASPPVASMLRHVGFQG